MGFDDRGARFYDANSGRNERINVESDSKSSVTFNCSCPGSAPPLSGSERIEAMPGHEVEAFFAFVSALRGEGSKLYSQDIAVFRALKIRRINRREAKPGRTSTPFSSRNASTATIYVGWNPSTYNLVVYTLRI
ncbi:MAG: hypothetical protein OXN17_05795 [Candidatus Poribacteria bacterium]|nr:hypothetical protein [Candidatus Poribacteria bacterium]